MISTNDQEDIRLRQDNQQKLYVDIPKKEIEMTLKNITNWRSTTKKYKTYLERFNALGSVKRDEYIRKLYLITSKDEISFI